MRVAWFSPLPPAATGIAAYSADLLPLLETAGIAVARYERRNAHDFVWRHRQSPYDLVVYQMGNSQWHDYMWAYLFAYPGLVVLHDARLHHARASILFRERRVDDYRREFAYNQPDAAAGAAEYAIEGLRGAPFYLWPMIRSVVESARLVAVHNEFVAQQLRSAHPGAEVERLHLGVPSLEPAAGARSRIRQKYGIPEDSVVFTAFGLVTREKRVEPILRAFAALAAATLGEPAPHLMFVGANEVSDLEAQIAGHGLRDRVHVTGFVEETHIADYLAAADVSVSLRWPTALETSAAWARSLAASKPTIITSLPHTADVPAIDARSWRPTRLSREPVAVSVDMLDEDASLAAAMSRLAGDRAIRERLADAARRYWKEEHDVALMAEDYRRVLARAAVQPIPAAENLPSHLRDDYSERAQSIAREIGVEL